MTLGPVVQIRQVRKQYHGLRPLRMMELTVGAGERVALSGLDAGAAEVFVNLVTGASVRFALTSSSSAGASTR